MFNKFIAGLSLLQRIGIGSVVVVVLVTGIYHFTQPERSVANYCNTFQTEGDKLHQQWALESKQASNAGGLGGIIGNLGIVASAPNDIANFFDKLDKVAPDDIEPDIATLRDAYKKDSDVATNMAGGNILGGLAQGFMLSLSSKSAEDHVNTYTSTNCHIGNQSGTTPSSTPSTTNSATQTSKVLSLDGVPQDSLKLWEQNQSGIIGVMNNTLVLINPANGSIIAQHSLPQTQGRTPGGDSGKSYTLRVNNDNNFDIFSFDKDYRHIPLVFANSSDGKYLGLYDLADSSVTSITGEYGGEDTPPFFDPTSRNDMVFPAPYNDSVCGDSCWYTYNLTNKETAQYTGLVKPKNLDQDYYDYNGDYVSNGYVWDKTHTSLIQLGKDTVLFGANLSANLKDGLGCTPIQMLDDTNLLCRDSTQLYDLDISNIINNKTATDDPSSYSYQPGRLHYEIPKPVPLLPNPVSSIGDIMVSSDDNIIVFNATSSIDQSTALYRYSFNNGRLMTLADEPTSLSLLEWR